MLMHITRFILMGIFSLSAISLLTYQGIEIVHSISDLLNRKH
jgi:hypothetical protein